MYIELMIYAVIGSISGFLAGLLGVGGGVFAVPALFFFFGYLGIGEAHLMHVTIATSLASMIFSTLSATLSHQTRKTINWSMARGMLLGIILGSGIGAYIAQLLSNKILELIFGLFLAALSIWFFFPESHHHQKSHFRQPHFFYTNVMGFSISSVAALLGLGGGLFTVPWLTACKMSLRQAVSTSAAVSLFITITGSICYFFLGWHRAVGAVSAWGFIYVPAFIMIGIFSFLTAPWGVRAVHTMEPKVLRRIFGALLTCVGVYMILQSIFQRT